MTLASGLWKHFLMLFFQSQGWCWLSLVEADLCIPVPCLSLQLLQLCNYVTVMAY